jgi:hypothetical protein
VDGQDGAVGVVFAAKHGREIALLELGFDDADLALELGAQRIILHLGQFKGVVDAALEGTPAVDLVTQAGGLLAYLLCRLGVVPEFRCGDPAIQFAELFFLGDEVKDAPVIARSVPWHCLNVRSGLA